MDYLDILRNDAKLAEDFDTLFDFRLLDALEERDTAEGRCTFSLPGMAFAVDGTGGEYHLLEDGAIGYWSSEGAAGRLAESMDDLFHLIIFSICWHDYCDSSKYSNAATLEEYGQNKQLDIMSYSPMELWEPIANAFNMSMEIKLTPILQKFYDAAHRVPVYTCYFHEDDGSVTESENLFF
ncbi:hypothetical protein [Veillonella tobetsuensis]|uniref:Uncharacterized protein n=1 Tax=Veillonella tobetsuensis TaxID=1110546 RepID=A0A2S7ZQB1_9FIRM|nr:hypothetical protein [Veillonella tobetsuensis]PQL25452.1 hypothetical protein VTHSUH11_05065 [Veillonella tobetsuensis]